jgi:hypothetical protein
VVPRAVLSLFAGPHSPRRSRRSSGRACAVLRWRQIRLEHCALTDDGRACALEYNILRWGRSELSPEAGIAVYVRGVSGRLASARIYDDLEPPLGGKP